MMARSTRGSNQRPDTLMQDRTSANSMKVLLQRTAGPYIWVKSRQSVLLGLCPLYRRKRTNSSRLDCGNSCQPLNGNLLVRPFGGSRGHVFRIEMSNPLAPHSDECPRRQLIHRFPRVFDGREGIPPDRAFAPFFALLLAFAGGTHGFPGDAIRLVDVLGGAFPALLMDQVKIAQGRLLVRHPLEQNAFGNDLVGGSDGIVAGITNL